MNASVILLGTSHFDWVTLLQTQGRYKAANYSGLWWFTPHVLTVVIIDFFEWQNEHFEKTKPPPDDGHT